jgi:hypothetical protein
LILKSDYLSEEIKQIEIRKTGVEEKIENLRNTRQNSIH